MIIGGLSITREEVAWLMMYWYNHMHYMATVDEPMCDRIEDLLVEIDATGEEECARALTDWYNANICGYDTTEEQVKFALPAPPEKEEER